MPAPDPDLVDLVDSFRLHHELSRGGREQRLASADYRWAWDDVLERLDRDADPFVLLDALFDDAGDDEDYLGYLGVTCLEYIVPRPTLMPTLAQRCHDDARWALAVRVVRLSRCAWESLPPTLRQLITDVIEPTEQPTRKRTVHHRRASKRQDRRPRT